MQRGCSIALKFCSRAANITHLGFDFTLGRSPSPFRRGGQRLREPVLCFYLEVLDRRQLSFALAMGICEKRVGLGHAAFP